MRGTAISSARGLSRLNGASPRSVRPAGWRCARAVAAPLLSPTIAIADARCHLTFKQRKSKLSIAGLASVGRKMAGRDLKIQSNQDSGSYDPGGTGRHWNPPFLERCCMNRVFRKGE
jgi:hypothetical protein